MPYGVLVSGGNSGGTLENRFDHRGYLIQTIDSYFSIGVNMTTAAYDWLREHAWSGRVRLRPFTVSLDPDRARFKDAVWLCAPNEDGGVRVHNISTGHFTDLLPEDVVQVEPDPDAPKDGLAHAVLTLARRPVLRAAQLWWM